ncbi:MAG: hypothetical protein R6W78_16150 [Bacteroidales bacterium]
MSKKLLTPKSLTDTIVRIGLFVAILCLFSNTTNAQSVFEDRQKENIIKNEIASQTTWDYKYIKDKPSKTGIKTSYIRYDQAGNIIESVTYKMQDTLAYETYKYNKLGKRTDYTKKKGVVVAYQKTSNYNEMGDLVKESGFDGAYNFQNNFEYLENGNLKHITYTLDKKLTEKRVFQHEGDMTTISIQNPSGVVMSYISLKHDSKDNVVEEVALDAQKKPVEKKLFVYNNDNKVVSEVKYRGDNFLYKLTYLYNDKGNLVTVDEENPEEGKYSKKQYLFDQSGNLTSMRWRRNAKEDFSERNYQYDNRNICQQYETYYPATKFRILTKLTYDNF